MSCQTAFPKICGYYLSASTITFGASTSLHKPRTTDYSILDKIDEYGQNWLSHLERMPQNRIPLKSYHYRLKGRRTVGRPKKRWREHL